MDREDAVFLSGAGLMMAGAWLFAPGGGLLVGGVMLILWLFVSRSQGPRK